MSNSRQSRVRALDNARYHGGTRSQVIDTIVMHNTAGASGASSIGWMNRLGPSGEPLPRNKRTSYHYIIERDGTILRMTPVSLIAYHAGDSAIPADPKKAPTQGTSLNSRSIGIAWANRDDGEVLTDEQIESALWLCTVMMEQHPIPIERVVGHYEVAPKRKTDPKPAIDMVTWRAKLAAYLSQRRAA